MRQWLCYLPIFLVESFPLLVVFLVAQFVSKREIVTSRQVEHRTSDVSLRLPHLIDDSVNVVDLEELVQLELSYILEHSDAFYVRLLEHELNLTWPVDVLEHIL